MNTSKQIQCAIDALQIEIDDCKVQLNSAQRRFQSTKLLANVDWLTRLERAHKTKLRQIKVLVSELKAAKLAEKNAAQFWVVLDENKTLLGAYDTRDEGAHYVAAMKHMRGQDTTEWRVRAAMLIG